MRRLFPIALALGIASAGHAQALCCPSPTILCLSSRQLQSSPMRSNMPVFM
jgi:hypothetical protein